MKPAGCFATLLILLAGSPSPASACTCAGRVSACEQLGRSSTIFIGKVVSSDPGQFAIASNTQAIGRHVLFEVLETFRGTGEQKIAVRTGVGNGDCGYRFEEGKVYLVYGYEAGAEVQTSICSGTGPVEQAESDIAFFRSLSSRGPEGRVSGYVSTDRPGRLDVYDGKGALPGVVVWLESGDGKRKALTNGQGEYRFEGLFPGRYRVWAELPRKLGGGDAVSVTVARQACVTVPFIGEETGSISGALRDSTGRPVAHAWVELLRASDHQPAGVEKGFSREDGRFTIRRVPEGEYLIGVHVTEPPRGSKYLWHPYRRSFYPGVSDPAAARTITVKAAEVVTGMDWSLGVPLRGRAIRGVVLGPDDKPAWPVFVELKVDGYEDNAHLAETARDGTFKLEGLAELRYFVQASSRSGDGSEAWHCHRLPVPAGDEPLIIKLDRPGKDCDSCRRRR